MTTVTEIAPDVYRISTYLKAFKMQFNQFLVRDDEPLLYHSGLQRIFPQVHAATAKLVDPKKIRWVGFSHYEADECGALTRWQAISPAAEAVCSKIAKYVSVDDSGSSRPARGMADGEVLETGRYRFRFLHTPHVPHCWEAGMLFEESTQTLFCSDLFTHPGEVEAYTTSDVAGRFKQALIEDQEGPFANAYPYTAQTAGILNRLGELEPKTLAIMHGSAFGGDCRQAIGDLDTAMREVLGAPVEPVPAAA